MPNIVTYANQEWPTALRKYVCKGTASAANEMVAVAEAISEEEALALAGKRALVQGQDCQILSALKGSAGSAALTLSIEVIQKNGDIILVDPQGMEITGERLSTNSHYTGERKGTAMQDALGTGNSPHYTEVSTVRFGTMMQDAADKVPPKATFVKE